ncbi:MAG: hypothetical protein ACAI35_04365 [Candidatus Methylacidiphilales bacterium]|nr:hypothetical protein [Candidatus Methylacidiphilales bacterium]
MENPNNAASAPVATAGGMIQRDTPEGHATRLSEVLGAKFTKYKGMASNFDGLIASLAPGIENRHPQNKAAQTALLAIRVKQAIGLAATDADKARYDEAVKS